MNDIIYHVDNWWNSFTYFFIRKYSQIKNVFRWLPIIWKQFDFDYSYSIEVFRFQLLKQAELMETNGMSVSSDYNASRIRTIIALMDKVYGDYDYGEEYYEKVVGLYGNYDYEIVPIVETLYNPITKKEEGLFEMKQVWERDYTKEELVNINAHVDEILMESNAKQQRAHKLLWDLVEHNIQNLW